MLRNLRFLLIILSLCLPVSAAAATLGEDGLYKQNWFTVSFRDIREDIETAAAEGKRLALIFEQRGCIYCKQVHEKVLIDPEVRSYLQENFSIVQYNLYGDEEVTDLDGDSLTEKTAARKWNVIFTPTIVFLPEKAESDTNVADAAVAVMPGAFRKGTFLDMFTWVREKGYAGDEDFQRFHARRIRERSAAGKVNTD